ncbi:MAG: hypothetical protein M5U28_35220 [Sandaracinaceae bacterium]|nr:hypothetical protein [Sandaracinaceae bacterium]
MLSSQAFCRAITSSGIGSACGAMMVSQSCASPSRPSIHAPTPFPATSSAMGCVATSAQASSNVHDSSSVPMRSSTGSGASPRSRIARRTCRTVIPFVASSSSSSSSAVA